MHYASQPKADAMTSDRSAEFLHFLAGNSSVCNTGPADISPGFAMSTMQAVLIDPGRTIRSARSNGGHVGANATNPDIPVRTLPGLHGY